MTSVLIVGRSPGVLLEAVGVLRAKGYDADATNQFADVLEDYDVAALDLLVFGGMVPADMKQRLRDEACRLNPEVTVIQGLGGIPGLIAAQVEAAATSGATADYDNSLRSIQLTLADPAHVVVEAWWGTSFQPPEPQSTHAVLFDSELEPGRHSIPIPDEVPAEASFAAARVGKDVYVFTIGPMPASVTRLAPTTSRDQRLPEVKKVRTRLSRLTRG